MLAEKTLASWLAASAIGTIFAAASAIGTVTQQDAIAWIGIGSTAGLAVLNLYQKLREERRRQLAEDLKLTAASDREKASQLSTENQHLRDQLSLMEIEAKRWLTLYKSTLEETEQDLGGASVPEENS